MKKQVLLLGVVLHGCLFSARAQQDSARLYQKAEQLMTAMKIPDIYAEAINSSVEQQIKTTPALAGYKADLKIFFDSCIGWSAVKADVAKLYQKYYSPSEIDALIAFYRTPAGQKVTAVSADLQKALQTLQQTRLTAHIDEWNAFIAGKVNGKSPDADAPGNN